MSVPQSTVRILDVPLNNRYEHTYYFESKAEQSAFFLNKVKKTFSAYTFIRKSWDIKVTATLEEADSWRYLTFKNSATGKDYYYFITNVEYVNDATVLLKLEIDVLQTYLFDFGLRQCFIERQHTESDNVGEHTLDEGLEVGTVVNAHVYNLEDLKDMCVLILSAIQIETATASNCVTAYGRDYDGVFSGLAVYACDDASSLQTLLDNFNTWGYTDGIVAMWMYPKNLITLASGETWTTTGIKRVSGTSFDNVSVAGYDNYASKLFGGYKPQNNKLYCYPYNFLYVSNNGGNFAEYRFEHMSPDSEGVYWFECHGALSPDAGVKLLPYSTYRGVNSNYEEGLTLGGFPACAWNSDTYKVWLAQNQASMEHARNTALVTAGGGALASVASIATGNVAGAVGGLATAYHGLTQIQAQLAQKEDMQSHPPQASGSFSSNVNVSAGRQTFTFYYKTLRYENAKIIDDYFNRYGYRIGRVGIPNIHARKRYTYVKTIGCALVGSICSEDISKIASIFDNGVTFWDPNQGAELLYGSNPVLTE